MCNSNLEVVPFHDITPCWTVRVVCLTDMGSGKEGYHKNITYSFIYKNTKTKVARIKMLKRRYIVSEKKKRKIILEMIKILNFAE